MTVHIPLAQNSYDIVIERGVLARAGEELNLNRKVLIVTDTGVPQVYAQQVAACCQQPFIVCVEQGEGSKSIAVWESLLHKMLAEGFTRFDAVVAVGGGVVGDLAGFCAASYMRGVDFYNIPTTLLSQVDSSVGGKTAVNFEGIKNIIGAFYQPKKVLIDPAVLETLEHRHFGAGLAEAIKMAVCFDEELFSFIETQDAQQNIDQIIEKSIRIKAMVVEKDEKEAGLRKALNFGHTIGHAIEANSDLYHGECVAIGMLSFCSEPVAERLKGVLHRYGLPTACEIPPQKLLEAAKHDKKSVEDEVDVVYVETIGSFTFKRLNITEVIR